MRILIVTAVFTPEPIVSAKLSEDLAIKLSENHEITVVAPYPSRPSGFVFSNQSVTPRGYLLVHLESFTCSESSLLGRLRESFSFGMACKSYITKHKSEFDCIYMSTWPVLAQYLTVRVGHKLNIRVITHVQDIYPESLSIKVPRFRHLLNLILIPFDKVVLRKSSRVIVISEKMMEYIIKTRQLPPNKLIVVSNWQDEDTFIDFENSKEVYSSESSTFTFMYLGNLGPVAGVDFLIESFEKAHLENCRLVIAGSGSKKNELRNLVYAHKMDNVDFVDVPDGKVPEIQSSADVMLLPIRKGAASSSIPSKLPAYMFSRKPIIAAVDIDSDTANAIRDAQSGWVIEPENSASLVNIMRKVSKMHRSKLLKVGQNGFNYAMMNYSKKKNLTKIIDLFS